MSRITILGSGTTNLVPERNAASVLIERNGKRIVYDFGRGTAIRLVEAGLKQDDIQTVVLSHFHPDHVTDLLPYLHAASWSQVDSRSTNLTIYGKQGIRTFLSELFAVFGWDELGKGFAVNVEELPVGETEISGQTFEIVDLEHSYGLRFEENGRTYAIMGDASMHEGLVDGLKNSELGVFDAGHLTDEEIVNLAVQTQATQLVCSHQYRSLDIKQLNDAATDGGFQGELISAEDGMGFEF